MKIAIVGSSRLTVGEATKALDVIHTLQSFADEIITGDADGIDAIVRMCGLSKPVTVMSAGVQQWEGQNGFKMRNIRIAQLADKVYSIATKKIKDKRCYHCNKPNHDRTGGCWTKRYAIDKLNKPGETIVI